MSDYLLPVVAHPTYEDGTPMLLGDEVIVVSVPEGKTSTATIIEMRFHPDGIVWMFVQGEGHYRNSIVYDHKNTKTSYIREKAQP